MLPENKQQMEEMAMDLLKYSYNHHDDAEEAFQQGIKLVEKLREIDETEMNAENQAERLQVEREKLDAQRDCEEMKQHISWRRAALELAKVGVPCVVSGILYWLGMNKVGKFEETGRWNSDASRMVRNNGPKLKF